MSFDIFLFPLIEWTVNTTTSHNLLSRSSAVWVGLVLRCIGVGRYGVVLNRIILSEGLRDWGSELPGWTSTKGSVPVCCLLHGWAIVQLFSCSASYYLIELNKYNIHRLQQHSYNTHMLRAYYVCTVASCYRQPASQLLPMLVTIRPPSIYLSLCSPRPLSFAAPCCAS